MKYQILRFKNGTQQHYNTQVGEFENSQGRFSGEFNATYSEVKALMCKMIQRYRKTRGCSLPRLHCVS